MTLQAIYDDAIRPALGLLPVRRTAKNVLYERTCSGCGEVKWVDKRKVHRLCMACSNKSRSTHGLANSKLYRLLKNIQARCTYPSSTNYAYYGGRGIKVCDEWASDPATFASWALANGYAPGLDIDRIDNDGDYRPDNCRFVTRRENSQKRSHIKTSIEQARAVKEALAAGSTVKAAAVKAGVTYMVAWHIKNSPGVWENA